MNENLTPIPGRNLSGRTAPRAGRKAGVAVLGLALAVSGVACSSSKKTSTKDSGTTGLAAATLTASGSTFQQPFDNLAITGFNQDHSNITINYGGGGSGTGKTDLQNKVDDFAGTDSLIKDKDLAGYKGGKVLYFPTVAAPITVSYNLPGVADLKLSGPTLAKIFSAKIKTWNDPAIKQDNAGVTLPATAITIVHRAEKSGTTSNFTKFLSKSGGADWTLGASDLITWPADSQAGQGNAGVAGKIGTTPGAIGYVDFSDALKSKLTVASVKNAAGEFVKPTTESAGKAVASATVNADLTYDPIDAPGAGAYPITSPTWIIAYQTQTNKAKGEALKAFLDYVLTKGQTFAATAHYVALPPALAAKAIAQLDKLQIPTS